MRAAIRKEEEQRRRKLVKKEKRQVKDAALHSDPSEISEPKGDRRQSQVSQIYSQSDMMLSSAVKLASESDFRDKSQQSLVPKKKKKKQKK